jgi:hypothetical protein
MRQQFFLLIRHRRENMYDSLQNSAKTRRQCRVFSHEITGSHERVVNMYWRTACYTCSVTATTSVTATMVRLSRNTSAE